ncbi:MAG: sterol desaturase family protein [Nitrospirales bacterium]
MSSLVRYGAYPVVLSLGIVIHMALRQTGVNLHIATYVPVGLGALMITALEWRAPFRQTWWADKREIGQDAIFMALIQGVLPPVMAFAFSVTLLDWLQKHEWTMNSVWPHDWPVAGQMLLMMVLADGMRYWLHRWAHEWEPLWRFHAVHHSPHKLYWLNVGRFHPVDKGLQFLLDSLPFVLIGVKKEVLALYVVCYAINGFFQHCNIDLSLGLLNYVISGPELHRWHHSKSKQESNYNYGNNLIVWDWTFGTRFLPRDREVDELGLVNRSYPMTFWKQMSTPFIPGADKATILS